MSDRPQYLLSELAQAIQADIIRFDEINRSFKMWSESTAAILHDHLSAAAAEAMKRLTELFPPDLPERMKQERDRKYAAYVALARQHHWLVPSWFPWTAVGIFEEILEGYDKAGPIIRQMFIAEFADNNFELLDHMVARWKTQHVLGHGRWKVLRDCAKVMRSHAHHRFNGASVVIPAIIAVIDGLLIDFAKHDLGLAPKGTGWRDTVKSAMQSVDNQDSPFEEPARFLAFDVLFCGANHGQEPMHGMGFNRNKIMHGEHVRYGTAANALRAFFVVDFLVDVIQEYRTSL